MKVKLIFAWYDLWVGLFIDKQKKKIYIFPVPMLGVVIQYKKVCPEKVNGSCPHHNLFCKYPDCEK